MRQLSPDEQTLWARVTSTVRKFGDLTAAPLRPAQIRPIREAKSWVLDLHNRKIHDAYFAVTDFIESAVSEDVRHVTIITGRSGQIRREFLLWLSIMPVSTYQSLPGDGSFRLSLPKPRKS